MTAHLAASQPSSNVWSNPRSLPVWAAFWIFHRWEMQEKYMWCRKSAKKCPMIRWLDDKNLYPQSYTTPMCAKMGGVANYRSDLPIFHTGSIAEITNFGKVNHGLSTVEVSGNQQKDLRKKTREITFVCSNATHTLLPPKNWLRVRNSKNAIAHAESSFLTLRLLCSSLGNCTLFCVECIYQYTCSQCVRCIQTQHDAHVNMTSVSETSHENGQLISAGRPWTGVPTMNVLWIRGLLKITLVSLKCL